MAFRKLFDGGWVAIFRITAGAHLGLVNATGGCQSPVDGPNKGALLAIHTPELEAWYERLKSVQSIEPPGRIIVGSQGLTRQFQVRDPGGYIIEFFRWIEPPSSAAAGRTVRRAPTRPATRSATRQPRRR